MASKISGLISKLKEGAKFNPEGQIASKTYNIGKKLALGTGAVFGAVMIYMLRLGAAAAKGAIIGATVGGSAGTALGIYVGFNIGVALAPFTFGLSIPVFTVIGGVTGGFVGGTVGAVTGGLIGLGVASGSITVISMGVGAGVGGTVGAYAGYTAGTFAGTVIAQGIVAACAAVTGGACLILEPLVPLGGALGGAIGGTVGAYFGAAAGASAGYVVGNYIVEPTKDFISGGTVATSNVLGGIGSTVTGWISAGWNAAISTAGNVLSFAGSLINGAVGLISGAGGASAATTSITQVAVGGAVGTVATATVVAGILTNTTFFTPEGDPGSVEPPGVNQNYTLTKTAQPPSISGIGPETNITFTVKVQAKSKTIISIGFIENFRYLKNGVETRLKDPHITITTPIPPGETRESTFTLNTLSAELPDGSFITIPGDSLIINGVASNATMDGGSNQIENVSVTVPIGSPPTNCPTRWPITGFVTQGPEGGTSHADEIYGGYEALDIGAPVGTTVYNTVDGVVDYTDDSRGTLDQRVGVIPNGCPNLRIIHYWHLSRMDVTPGQSVSATTTVIGASGHSAPHLHYQFNNTGERDFRQEPPNIPTAVPRTCNGDCSDIITNAP